MQSRQKISFAIAALGLAVILVLLLNALFGGPKPAPPRPITTAIGGPFSLTDQTGTRRSAADFAGRPLLIFFGFTYCPDVCPTALDRVGAALDVLRDTAPESFEAVQPLFISVDPARDTPDALAAYLAYFHPKIIGLTGSAAEITGVKKAYKVYAARAAEPAANGAYLIDHSSLFYLMDGENRYVTHFDHAIEPADLAAGIVKALKPAR